ncbi:protein TIC 22-like, chloroplastic [Gastrolobium bilobum]|uniref:protein TIC 22-like, chloroplastic n=1 Tax=Gastrolobium bilobum TaxID=150636 RepID=UPI002AB1DD23|nr:protein TIC 22-like, chloroplastic [Gastrolobium bilobum]
MNLENFQKAFQDLQRSCSTLLHNLTQQPFKAPHHGLGFPTFKINRDGTSPPWARISQNGKPRPMSVEAIEERLEGVPVYALSNAAEEFLLVSGASTGKNLGLFCFNKDDAETLLNQVTAIDPHMRQGSKVVPVALNKVFQLKVNGVAFRLIPEFSQVKNALREREKSGLPSDDFSGVPVFQSRSLILKSQDKRYRPLFFRKEDLENSLQRASSQQKKLNPALKQGDIQVATLEDVIKEMKGNSRSNWDDVIFIPPGFDVSTDPNQQ